MVCGRVLRSMSTHNAAIWACEEGGPWLLAVELLAEVLFSRVQRDNITYSAAVSACEKGDKWMQALELRADMAHSVQRNTIAHSASSSASEKGGQGAQAGVHALRTSLQTVQCSALALKGVDG